MDSTYTTNCLEVMAVLSLLTTRGYQCSIYFSTSFTKIFNKKEQSMKRTCVSQFVETNLSIPVKYIQISRYLSRRWRIHYFVALFTTLSIKLKKNILFAKAETEDVLLVFIQWNEVLKLPLFCPKFGEENLQCCQSTKKSKKSAKEV